MTSLSQTRIPFKPLLLASALALLLGACGGGNNSGGFSGFIPPTSTAPPPAQPPAAQPEPDQLVSKARFTPNAGTTKGSSDASTAIALPDNFMIVADDEANVLRVYPRGGGAAVKEWSYELEGPKLAKELDLEAGTRIGDTLYFTGSNSNKKDGADAAADRSHLFAVKVSGTGAATAFDYVGQFSLLEAQLIAWDTGNLHGLGANRFGFAVSAAAGIAPERVDGFSIEGMTSAPGDTALWLGFRAPQTGTQVRAKALIVPLQNYAALMAGTTTQATFGAPIELELGGRGIRSIDKGTDGKYLIVAGPAGAAAPEVDRNFALFAWDGNPNSAPVELSNDLDALRKETGGSFESTVEVPGPVTAGTQVQLLLDNGDTKWDGKTASKDLPAADQKFDGFVVRLGKPWVDTAAPKLQKSMPAAGRVGVNLDTSITLSFNEAVRLGSGSIVLHKADGSVIETFHTNSPAARLQVAFNVLKLVPTAPLELSTGYYITVDANAITDAAGNAFAGISDATKLSFTTTAGATPLVAGDLLFMAANAEAPDAYAFVLLKAVNGGTQVLFTDRDRKAGTTEFTGITNETAFFWTADQNLPAGTIVTIQTDVTGNPIADKGFTLGSPGGIGKSETIYAIAGGTIAGLDNGQAGQITAVGNHLATITLGGAAGTIPDAVTTAGTGISFTVLPANQTNAIYNGSLDRSDLAAFAARVKDPANWIKRYAPEVGYPLTNDSLFGDKLP
ncbi:methionine-rich copper-binding protein CopC [Variovorax boronicumulans]|uniref:Ig-like domain-containing protein n=1 Tax=Variovorax boronicumulans TaxID=436515 RepID=UPI00277D4554|nr:Ig-like domain-containing protein [Variovorax boronicumulans]MDQ0082380.1 methionine-rich copper-binding protein CopC [Variovorax boronicumulans]